MRSAPRLVVVALSVLCLLAAAPTASCQECDSEGGATTPNEQGQENASRSPGEEAAEAPTFDLRERMGQGDALLGRSKYAEAIAVYTDVVKQLPKDEVGYLKRSLAYARWKKVDQAMGDLNRALGLNPQSKQALLRRAQLRRSSCLLDEARADLDALLALKADHKVGLAEVQKVENLKVNLAALEKLFEVRGQGGRDFDDEAHDMAAQYFSQIFQDAEFCTDVEMRQAKVHTMRRDWEGVVRQTNAVLQYRSSHKECLMVRADAHYQQLMFDAAKQTIAQIFRTHPEDEDATRLFKRIKKVGKMKTKADKLANSNKVRQALGECKKILDLGADLDNRALETFLYKTLCESHRKVEKYAEAADWCAKGLDFLGADEDSSMRTALAESYLMMEKLDMAEAEARRVLSANRSNRKAHEIIQEVQKQKKMTTRKDYYKILEVDKRADEATIKKAYKKLARKWHPDKNRDNIEAAQKMFHDVAEAYEVLTDPEKKALFDMGEDPNDPQARMRQQQHQHFGFQGGGHPFFQQGGFQHGGGGQQFHFTYG